MASLSTTPNGIHRVFFGSGTNRRCLYIGKASTRDAEKIHKHVESLVSSKVTKMMDPAAGAWVASLDDEFYTKLSDLELVPSRKNEKIKLVELIRDFEASKSVKASTMITYKQCTKSICEYFGADRLISTITPLDALKWRKSLADSHIATATASKRTTVAKQMFRRAVKWEILKSNPFEDVVAGSQANPSRAFFVSRESIQLVLDRCPHPQWRAIIGLSRFAGLRCPSEVMGLQWSDVHFDRARLVIWCEKTSHIAGKERREVPIVPELMQILLDAHAAAEPGTDQVITRYRETAANLRTQFYRILRRAGLAPWPRLFHNMRASCETELAQDHPAHVTAEWMGHSPQIAAKHYMMVRDTDFTKASNKVYESSAPGALESAHNRASHTSTHRSTMNRAPSQPLASQALMPKKTTPCTVVQGVFNDPNGIRTHVFRMRT